MKLLKNKKQNDKIKIQNDKEKLKQKKVLKKNKKVLKKNKKVLEPNIVISYNLQLGELKKMLLIRILKSNMLKIVLKNMEKKQFLIKN